MPDDGPDARWLQSRAALRHEVDRVIGLLRSVDPAPDSPVVGHWNLAEVAAHLAQVWVGIPGMARGDWSEIEQQLSSEDGATTPATMRDLADLGRLTADLVGSDEERDLTVLADRIETRADDYFAACAGQDPTVRRGWLIDGTTVPTATFTDHLLSENLVHGYDIASAAGRRWPIDPAHARLALQRFLVPVLTMLDPHAAVNAENVVGVRATYEIRIRGGERFQLRFDDGAMHVQPSSTHRVDCFISAEPVALLLLIWGRQTQWPAIARGKFLSWGRRPWLALRLPALIKNP